MKAEISVTAIGGKGSSLRLDGVDVTRAVRGFTLDSQAGEFTRLTLDLLVSASAEAEVTLHPATHEMLVDLGWTPPGGDAA